MTIFQTGPSNLFKTWYGKTKLKQFVKWKCHNAVVDIVEKNKQMRPQLQSQCGYEGSENFHSADNNW